MLIISFNFWLDLLVQPGFQFRSKLNILRSDIPPLAAAGAAIHGAFNLADDVHSDRTIRAVPCRNGVFVPRALRRNHNEAPWPGDIVGLNDAGDLVHIHSRDPVFVERIQYPVPEFVITDRIRLPGGKIGTGLWKFSVVSEATRQHRQGESQKQGEWDDFVHAGV